MYADGMRAFAWLALAGVAALLPGCSSSLQGEVAPEIRGAIWIRPEGTEHLKAREKWVLVEFFDPSLSVCRSRAADLIDMQKEYGNEKFVVIGITRAERVDAEAFVDELGLNYPVIPIAKQLFEDFGVKDAPHATLIDPYATVVIDNPTTLREVEDHLAKELG